MDDFDEAEEQNEEDLLELGDTFANINLKVTNDTALTDNQIESCTRDIK